MADIFNTLLYKPLYNGLILITSAVPGADIGIAVIILTLAVKFILFPLAHTSTKTQAKMRLLEPEIKALKEKHSGDNKAQAEAMMELYKKHELNPFSGCLTVLIQLPVIFALYWVFFKGLKIDPSLISDGAHAAGIIPSSLLPKEALYSFVSPPEEIKIAFLGLIDMTKKSVLLALLAGATQYFQIKLAMPGKGGLPKPSGSFKEDLAASMRFQMRFVLPVFVAVFAYMISAAVALYWATSNLFSIGHELLVRKNMADERSGK